MFFYPVAKIFFRQRNSANMSGELWHRDPKMLYPTVWREFERQSKINKDVIHKFQIRDATTDDIPQILQHMRENFLVDEPLCKILSKCTYGYPL